MSDWLYFTLAIVGLVTVTVSTRSGMWLLPASVELPVRVQRALRYAPGCALAGIIGPAIFVRSGDVVVWPNHALLATIAGAAVFLRTRNMLAMMAVGMAVLTALRVL